MLKEGIAKIADFGLSRIVAEIDQLDYFSRVGSTLYMSP
jgi:serine/threonine protein kinase